MIRDLRYAIRGLLGNPGFATVAILTIGIGIGANTAVFSWMRNVLLNPLPAASDPGRIVAIENTADNGDPLTTSFLDYTDYRDHLQFVDSVTLKKIQPFVVGEESHPERVWGEVVSGNFFDLLGVRPEIGRFFNREESGRRAECAPRGSDQPRLLDEPLSRPEQRGRRKAAPQSYGLHHHRGGAEAVPRFLGGIGYADLGANHHVRPGDPHRHLDAARPQHTQLHDARSPQAWESRSNRRGLRPKPWQP